MKPLVSILIPAYNSETWITETLASAVAQTWPRTEIIVIDDGSSDRTLAIAQKFSSASVAVVTQENQGASAARNRALGLCQGDYIQYLDADDLLAPDKIERQIAIADQCAEKGMLLSSAFGSFMYRTSNAHFQPTALWCDLSPLEWLLRKMGQNLYMQTSTWLVSHELSRAAGLWDTRLSLDDDGEYFCRVLLASKGVRFEPLARVYYRTSGSSRLSKVDWSDRKLQSQFLSIQLHISYLRSLEDSDRVRRACVRYLQSRAINYYPESLHLFEKMRKLAHNLGGLLEIPRLRTHYRLFEKVLGYKAAKRIQFSFRRGKWLAVRWRAKTLYEAEKCTKRGLSAAALARKKLLDDAVT